jgi:hypothetical protein
MPSTDRARARRVLDGGPRKRWHRVERQDAAVDEAEKSIDELPLQALALRQPGGFRFAQAHRVVQGHDRSRADGRRGRGHRSRNRANMRPRAESILSALRRMESWPSRWWAPRSPLFATRIARWQSVCEVTTARRRRASGDSGDPDPKPGPLQRPFSREPRHLHRTGVQTMSSACAIAITRNR